MTNFINATLTKKVYYRIFIKNQLVFYQHINFRNNLIIMMQKDLLLGVIEYYVNR